MKKLLVLPSLFPLLFLLTGCPYYSKVPLSSEPNTPIDTLLLGTWKLPDGKPESDSAEMRIMAFNKMEYYIEIVEIRGEKTEIYNSRAFNNSCRKNNYFKF